MSFMFEWDQNKSKDNIRKHKVSFEEAKTVFNDPLSITIVDHSHSASEERFIDVGFSSRGQCLVVVYTERGSRIRIISSRLATRKERRTYEEVI
jgi:hypothetical protein